MYIIVHNKIDNKYYLNPNKSNALSADTQEVKNKLDFDKKKFLFLIPSRPRKAVQDFDKKSFAVVSIHNLSIK